MLFHNTNESMLDTHKSSIFTSHESKIAYMESTAERIKKKRKELGWSQQRLGQKVGVSRAAVSQWENGDTKSLKNDNLLATAQALSVTVQWLVTGKESAPPPVAAVVDTGIVAQIIREIRRTWETFPDDDELATLIANGYARVMLRIRDSDREKIGSIVDPEISQLSHDERDIKGERGNE